MVIIIILVLIHAGIFSSFIFSLFVYWWLFLTIIIFWQVWFPVNARKARQNGHTKYIHAVVVVLSLVLSTIPVAAALGSGGYGTFVFPAFLNICFPRNLAAFFHSSIFIPCIILSIGNTFNLLNFWKVMRFRKQSLQQVAIYNKNKH